jgi:hypothetical protein
MEIKMADYSVSDIMDFAIDGDITKIQDVVDSIMKERAAEILASKKIEVAKALFNSEDQDA